MDFGQPLKITTAFRDAGRGRANTQPKETQRCELPRWTLWENHLCCCALDAEQEEYGPKMAQKGPNTAPKMAQDGPKKAPRWPKAARRKCPEQG